MGFPVTIRRLAILLVAVVLSVPASGSQQTISSADAALREDIYAVYSAMFANPDGGDKVYLIDPKTFPVHLTPPSTSLLDFSFNSEQCFTIPASYTSAWKEILAETNSPKNNPGTIERRLKIKTPYLLLTAADLREIGAAIGKGIRPPNPKFLGGTTLISLGNVYFNKNRTLALTARASVCGSLCGSGGNVVLEKGKDGKWQFTDWVSCHWIS